MFMKIMEETIAKEGINFLFLLLLVLVLLCFIYKYITSPTLPPGPFSWPIIGNILTIGKKPHVSLAQLAQAYGPLISLRLGAQLVVVGSSPAAAMEILKVHDRLLSGRSIPDVIPAKNPAFRKCSLAWNDCTDQWKYLRTICRTELFCIKAIESQSKLREDKVIQLVEYLGTKEGQVVNFGEVVFGIIFNMLSNILMSKDFINLEEEGEGEGMKGLVRTLVELGTIPNLADIFPLLSVMDLQGLKKKSTEAFVKICGFWEGIIKERREVRDKDILMRQRDFLDYLLSIGFNNDQINRLLVELLLAGVDTTTSTIKWTMVDLMKNQDAMKKVCIELEREINENRVKESDLHRLPYLHSCTKETLRLHPPAPLLLPHRALETCKVMNYTIPKDTQVFVNLWAIGRDPVIWDDPLVFKPERFLDSNVESKLNDFGWIPFGAGRRICPGQPMAMKQAVLILASLINHFDWSLPCDISSSTLNMDEKFGITLQKEQPLMLIPIIKR